MRSKRIWIVTGIIALLLVAAAGVVVARAAARQRVAGAPRIGEVTQITAVSSVESSGPVAAFQSGSLFWKTTGIVAMVNVNVGDQVKAGRVLMALDPASAPPNVILAQADLIGAQRALEELLHPTPMAIASAQKAVADAQEALDKAKQDLRAVENPAGQSLYDAVSDAELALQTAQANLELAHVGADATQLTTTDNNKNLAYSQLQRAQAEYDDCLKISCGERVQRENALTAAKNNYQSALDAYLTAQLKYETTTANQKDSLAKAQEQYDQAVANLNAALRGPDANKLAVTQAKVAVAEATLADAQDKLNKLLNGADPLDIAAAQARLQAAQATADALYIKAPFDGEVMAVNYRPGDLVSQTAAALVLANRSQLHVEVSVDESEVSQIKLAAPASITFNSLPDLKLGGAVSRIDAFGTAVQGLVKYTVWVDLAERDPRLLLGMTADVSIVTDRNEGALAVPLDAVQLDNSGEFVNRLKPGGQVERVNVVSGQVQGDLVVVSGPLRPGDRVQVLAPKPANSGSPFGGR